MDRCLENDRRDFLLTTKDVQCFKRLFEEPMVKQFLEWDRCSMLADKYLIATALVYFKRANFTAKQFTPFNLFVALYLTHDMEEDDLDLKNDLIRFAMSEDITESKVKLFLRKRDMLWHAINFRAAVNRFCCVDLMNCCLPGHSVWRRTRATEHGGVNVPFHVKDLVCNELRLNNGFSYSGSQVRCVVCEAQRFLYQKQLLSLVANRVHQSFGFVMSDSISKIRRLQSLSQRRTQTCSRKSFRRHFANNCDEMFFLEE